MECPRSRGPSCWGVTRAWGEAECKENPWWCLLRMSLPYPTLVIHFDCDDQRWPGNAKFVYVYSHCYCLWELHVLFLSTASQRTSKTQGFHGAMGTVVNKMLHLNCGAKERKPLLGMTRSRTWWLAPLIPVYGLWSLYDKDHMTELWIKNRSESDLRSCEVT